MYKRVFVFLALACALFGTQCWATPTNCTGEGEGALPCISNTFSPGITTGTYDFSGTGDGVLVVKFDTVLAGFTLNVTINHTLDALDSEVFPTGTACVKYSGKTQCDQYDFTGNAGGPNGVPVKNVDYKRLITLTLSYLTGQTAHDPAFGHAPGDSTTITEDILTSYSVLPLLPDPTMSGTTPGLSSVAALDKILALQDAIAP